MGSMLFLQHFHLQELLLNLMYAPQNLYCYALDAKSTALFHKQMQDLSRCFPNVFLTLQEYTVDSAGHNTSRSFLECLRMIRRVPKWKYVILLQVCKWNLFCRKPIFKNRRFLLGRFINFRRYLLWHIYPTAYSNESMLGKLRLRWIEVCLQLNLWP